MIPLVKTLSVGGYDVPSEVGNEEGVVPSAVLESERAGYQCPANSALLRNLRKTLILGGVGNLSKYHGSP
jgi:hypothetical protein